MYFIRMYEYMCTLIYFEKTLYLRNCFFILFSSYNVFAQVFKEITFNLNLIGDLQIGVSIRYFSEPTDRKLCHKISTICIIRGIIN